MGYKKLSELNVGDMLYCVFNESNNMDYPNYTIKAVMIEKAEIQLKKTRFERYDHGYEEYEADVNNIIIYFHLDNTEPYRRVVNRDLDYTHFYNCGKDLTYGFDAFTTNEEAVKFLHDKIEKLYACVIKSWNKLTKQKEYIENIISNWQYEEK